MHGQVICGMLLSIGVHPYEARSLQAGIAELAVGKEHSAECRVLPCTGTGYVSKEGWGPMKQEHLGNIKCNQGPAWQ